MAASTDPSRARATGVRLARLLPYAIYTATAATALALCWGRARPAWVILTAITYLALLIVQTSLDFFAAADAHADVPSARAHWNDARWTMPIAILCAAPIPVLGACLIAGGGPFAAACLVIASPVIARLMYDRCKRSRPPSVADDSRDA